MNVMVMQFKKKLLNYTLKKEKRFKGIYSLKKESPARSGVLIFAPLWIICHWLEFVRLMRS